MTVIWGTVADSKREYLRMLHAVKLNAVRSYDASHEQRDFQDTDCPLCL
jgi:hypothetical protein